MKFGKMQQKKTGSDCSEAKTDFNISKTNLITTRVKDEIVDENEKTGWSVQTVTKEPCILLFEESKFIQPKSVKQAILSQSQLFPGDTLKIKYLGNDYKLYATGIKKKNGDDAEWFEVMNYKLFLTTTIKGKNYKSLLAAQPNFDDNMITLIFAGDIDGDEILDLIIDTSRHYNVKNPTLYLSRPAKKGEIVKAVGSHKSVGC
jgi:hypothetical protein